MNVQSSSQKSKTMSTENCISSYKNLTASLSDIAFKKRTLKICFSKDNGHTTHWQLKTSLLIKDRIWVPEKSLRLFSFPTYCWILFPPHCSPKTTLTPTSTSVNLYRHGSKQPPIKAELFVVRSKYSPNIPHFSNRVMMYSVNFSKETFHQ